MRRTSVQFLATRKALADKLDNIPLTHHERLEVSQLVAKFTAATVRDDRVKRMPHDTLMKLADVFSDGCLP